MLVEFTPTEEQRNRLNPFLEFVVKANLLNPNVWLAGGSLMTLIDGSLKVNDFDLFFKKGGLDNMYIRQVEWKLREWGFSEFYRCPNGSVVSYTIPGNKLEEKLGKMVNPQPNPFGEILLVNELPRNTVKVQLVTKFRYATMQDCVDGFDFTACQLITDGTSWMKEQGTTVDILKKKINLVLPLTRPAGTLRRIIRYAVEKDFTCSPGTISAFVGEVLSKEWTEEELRVFINTSAPKHTFSSSSERLSEGY